MTINKLPELLQRKVQDLENTKLVLKNKFIGIDDVIDQFINSIRIWYLMPELMSRPMIVNLWGLTGCGKTDLVRTFVKTIKMTSSFVELQMDTSSQNSTIQHYIEYADLDTDTPSILLLDEMQRFRTIDEQGQEIRDSKSLQDIWMLLSDGRFQSESAKKKDLLEMVFSELYYAQEQNNDELTTESAVETREKKYKQTYWSSQRLKKLLGCTESVPEIMQWDYSVKMQRIKDALEDDATFEGTIFSKMLIIIAGNIDEAYSMASDVANPDTDADVLNEFSKRINVITIKEALKHRFKPEQIARFGNDHIIYPSLNKSNYQQIIHNNITDIQDRILKTHGIRLVLDHSVYDTIYENGVFPTQGVRPVYSTISTIFENFLPTFLFKAIENNINCIYIKYTDSNIIGTIGDEEIVSKVELSIKNIRDKQKIDNTSITAVHEAGHAVIYAVLFGVAPTQIKCSTVNVLNEGFTGVHHIVQSKRNIRKFMTMLMAGKMAEELVFGHEYVSIGSSSDLDRATVWAAGYVRTHGFDGVSSKVKISSDQNASCYNTDIADSNATIENMVQNAETEAKDLLIKHKKLLSDVVKNLIQITEMKPDKFAEICLAHDVRIEVKLSSDEVIDKYYDQLQNFLSQ